MWPCRAIRRGFSVVTTKVQRRRDGYIKTAFPEFAGHSPTETAPRRGRRLGGVFADPSRAVLKLDGSESFNQDAADLEESFLEQIRRDADPKKLVNVMDEFHQDLHALEAARDPISETRRKKIKSLVSADFQVLTNKAEVKQLSLPQPRTSPLPLTLRRERKAKRLRKNPAEHFPLVREEGEMFAPPLESSLRLRESGALPVWQAKLGAKFIDLYSTNVASVVTSTLEEYSAAKLSSAVFDVSYKQLLRISGDDAVFVMDHFVTGPVRLLEIGDALHACILDTKGNVLTGCLVARTAQSQFSLLLDGNQRESIFRFLAHFIVHSRQSGMQVHLCVENPQAVLQVHGPERMEHVLCGLKMFFSSSCKIFLGSPESQIYIPTTLHLSSLPAMSAVSIGSSISLFQDLDFATLTFSNNSDLVRFLHSLPSQLAGAYALDMLRMEQGEVRPGIDVTSDVCSPVRASLGSKIDLKKVREKVLFGHDRINRELAGHAKVPFRVGIVADQYVYGGCKLLSSPHRFPVGELTSCAWNPALQKRVCQGYIKPEFAVAGTQVLVNVPSVVPEAIDVRFKKRIAKQGAFQNVFRKLVGAKVIQFPIQT